MRSVKFKNILWHVYNSFLPSPRHWSHIAPLRTDSPSPRGFHRQRDSLVRSSIALRELRVMSSVYPGGGRYRFGDGKSRPFVSPLSPILASFSYSPCTATAVAAAAVDSPAARKVSVLSPGCRDGLRSETAGGMYWQVRILVMFEWMNLDFWQNMICANLLMTRELLFTMLLNELSHYQYRRPYKC